ncbi:unnamed protein product [Bemisia tabaci]|uniref:BROMI C-terminal Rab TBC-like domain-containing protein n=1 Tax=Bemisia tabaci TaxID=7038 RepID=A0A9P0ANV6_BEMTA|nr:unnamed protein product [Bemisia tabaci]
MPFLDRKGLPADIFCKDFQTDNAYQWNEPSLRLFVSYAINSKKSLETLIQYNYFTIRPFQNLLQSEAFYMTGFTTTQKEIYRAFMSIIFIISLSSEAFKEIVSQIKEPDAEDSILNLEEELNRVSVLYVIPCNLFYYSDSQSIFHFIALSALRVLFQNIDICICLSLKFNLQERMTDMENFATNNFKKSREIIIDECSLLRNELNNLSCCPGIYSSSLTHSESLQSEQKFKTAVQKRKQLNDLNKFLFDTKKGLHDLGWLKNLRKTFLSTLKDEVKCSTVLDIVEQVSKCGGYLAGKSIQWSLLEKKYLSKLSKFDEMAVSLVLRYGEKNNLLNENKDNKENYVQFLSRCETYFTPPPENSVQFDWFSATVFLICSGNIDRSLQILSLLSAFPSTVYSWLQLAGKRGQSWSMFGQLIEWLLSAELPKIYFLFQTKGVSWWLVYQSWMRQCFLNQLQWNEILQWILLIVLYPVDYQIYYSISVLKCSQESLLLSDQNDNFFDALMVSSVKKLLSQTLIVTIYF